MFLFSDQLKTLRVKNVHYLTSRHESIVLALESNMMSWGTTGKGLYPFYELRSEQSFWAE